MAMSDVERVAAIRQRLEAATEGPWEDREFLFHSRSDVEWLLEQLETSQSIASAAETIRETGGAVEIGGVRIEPCNERGETETTRGLTAATLAFEEALLERDEAMVALAAAEARIEAALALCDADDEASLRPAPTDFEPIEVPWTVAVRAALAVSGQEGE